MQSRNLACVVMVCLGLSATVRTQTVAALPSGWKSQDIGAVGLAGSASASGGTFTVSGAGADIWGTADAFHFAYRSLAGDGTIVAEVSSIVGSAAWTKVGVMIRASTQANSASALMLVSTAKGLAFQRRTATGVASTHTSGGTGTAPRWVKLTRAGSVITAYASTDGRTWTTVGRDTFVLPSTVLVGLATSSHDPTQLATATFNNVSVSTSTAAKAPWANGRLQVSPSRHFLQHAGTGKHFFYLADTAWGLVMRLDRAEVDLYLKDCAAKGFNAVQTVALWDWSSTGNASNAYGDHPLVKTNGKYDPARIITTPGNDPNDPVAYDYWDHLDYVIDKAAQYGLYVTLEPAWGNHVSGKTSYAFDMSSNVFTVANARTYGEFLGRRYASRPNMIWMLGGDRSAVYDNGDFRPVWRAMAEGLGRGVTGQTLYWDRADAGWSQLLMTYQATRRDNPGSSIWFHTDPWLDFNGIQAEYHNVATKTATDWKRTEPKPTNVIETRYEDTVMYDGTVFEGAWGQRYQLYQALFAGSLGYTYGHSIIWDYYETDTTWRQALNAPGRIAMQTVKAVLNGFTDAQLLTRVPDQSLLDGATGTGKTADMVLAMRGGDSRFALVYSMNGRDIRFIASKLPTGTADAYWVSPRTGQLYNGAGSVVSGAFTRITTGAGAPIVVFNPPGTAGAGNDWILRLIVR